MRIVFLYAKFSTLGGAENALIWLARGLQEKGHDVSIVTRSFDVTIWGKKENFPVKIVCIPVKNVSRYIRNLVYGLFLRKALKDADIICPHNSPAIVWAAIAKVAFRLKGRLVYYCQEPLRVLHSNAFSDVNVKFVNEKHQVYDKKTPIVFRSVQKKLELFLDVWATRKASYILANSKYSKECITRAFDCTAEVCYIGLPNGPRHSTKLIEKQHFLILTRLHPLKNVDKAILGYAEYAKKYNFFVPPLLIGGVGESYDKYESICKEKGVGDLVKFLGFVSDEKLTDLFSSSIAFIFLSEQEPFGLVIIESLYNNVPVVVSESGGPAEIVGLCGGGVLVKPSDHLAVSNALEFIVSMSDKGHALGVSGGIKCREIFNLHNYVNNFLTITNKDDS